MKENLLKSKKKANVPHVIRYFLVLSGLIFFAYWKDIKADWMLVFIGPCIYLASGLKNLLDLITTFPSKRNFYFLGMLLPVTVFYYLSISALIKNLWAERGILRIVSLLAFLSFIVFIHYLAWAKLTLYLTPLAAPE